MRKSLRRAVGLALLVGLFFVPTGLSQNEALEAAIDLFEQQEYEAAQTALLAIDAETLSEEEQAEREAVLGEVADAIAANEKAAQTLTAADAAFEAGEWAEADSLYAEVLDNPYAKDELTTRAASQRASIAEKRELEAVAEPTAPGGPMDTQNGTAITVEAAPPAEADVTSGRRTLVDELIARDDLLWQRAMARMRELAAQARAAIDQQEFDEARRRAVAAMQTVEANRKYATPVSKYEAAKAEAQALRNEVDDAYDDYQRVIAEQQRIEVQQAREERAARIERQKREQIEQYFNTVSVLRKQQKYTEAAEVLRQILSIDPTNAKAKAGLEWATDFASFNSQATADEEIAEQTRDLQAGTFGYLRPSTHIVEYPKNWPEIIRKRGGLLGAGQGPDPQQQREMMDARLDEVIEEKVEFDQTPLELVIEFIKDRYQLNIDANWQLLGDYNIDPETPISIEMREGTELRTVIAEILNRASPEGDLALDFRPNLLLIVPRDNLTYYPVTYDVRHMIYVEPPEDDQQGFGGFGGGGGDFGGGGGFSGGGGGFGGGGTDDDQRDEYEEELERIADTIQAAIDPDSWDLDGAIGIQLLNYLVITQTYENHKRIAEFIANSEGPGAGPGGSGLLQAAFEARFLTITTNYLEQIGVDLDFVFNAGTAGYVPAYTGGASPTPITDPFTGAQVLMPTDYARAGFYPAVPGVGQPLTPGQTPGQPYGQAGFYPAPGGIVPRAERFTAIPVNNNSIGLAEPGVTGIPGAFDTTNAALSIAGSFLDNLQVDFLIRATAAHRQSSIVNAPRLLVANGESGNIFIGRTADYISSFGGQVAEAAALPTPETDQAFTGISMNLDNVTISPNRRYVTSLIRITESANTNFQRVTVSQGSGNSPSTFITLVDQDQNFLETRASIPDGGTLLLGGLKRAGQIEVEAGPPILKDIPILNRAFNNRNKVKDVQTSLILIKANIVIPQEAEEEAFPQLGSPGTADAGM